MSPIASFGGCPAHIGLELSRSATIHVLPGALEFEFKAQPLLRAPAATYRQDGGEVRVNHVLFPPWLNTVVFLHDRSGLPLCAAVPAWRRRQVESALVEAGLRLVVKRRVLMGFAG